MGQLSGGNCCECRHWLRDPSLEKPTHGFCLRQNIGDRANIATPVIETKALDLCTNFVARNAQESAGSVRGAETDPALVITAAGICA